MFRNCMCDATHNKPSSLGCTDVNEVSKHIVFILGNNVFTYLDVNMIYCGSWLSGAAAQ